jgi:hypothetical protein
MSDQENGEQAQLFPVPIWESGVRFAQKLFRPQRLADLECTLYYGMVYEQFSLLYFFTSGQLSARTTPAP